MARLRVGIKVVGSGGVSSGHHQSIITIVSNERFQPPCAATSTVVLLTTGFVTCEAAVPLRDTLPAEQSCAFAANPIKPTGKAIMNRKMERNKDNEEHNTHTYQAIRMGAAIIASRREFNDLPLWIEKAQELPNPGRPRNGIKSGIKYCTVS